MDLLLKLKGRIKSATFRVLIILINELDIKIAARLFGFSIGQRPSIEDRILRNLSADRLSSLLAIVHDTHGYAVFGFEDSAEFTCKILKDSSYEAIHAPEVWGISSGGAITVRERGVRIFEFRDAEIIPFSDFVRVDQRAYWDKLYRFQLVKTIVKDQDLSRYDHEADYAFLENRKKKARVKNAFSLCGVHMASWGHFVGNFLPKLSALVEIENREELTIVLPKSVDSHIKEMVAIVAHGFGVNKLFFLEDDESVLCERLYYCSGPSFIADHADYIQPYDVHISNWAVSKLHEITKQKAISAPDAKRSLKLFIGRRGMRNVKNYEEVEQCFVNHGFEVIFPHQLTLRDKISKFASATHVCGPYSSGFANIIFCRPGTKILALTSIARVVDCFISDIAKGEFSLDVALFLGDDELPAGPHQAYSIPMGKLEDTLDCRKYFDYPF